MAEQHCKHLGGLAEVPLIPLNICHQQLGESFGIFCPELLLHLLLAEKLAIEAEDVIERAHAVVDVMISEEVTVWIGSQDRRWPNLLTCGCHVVGD